MKPTPAEIENGIPRKAKANTPPTIANGMPVGFRYSAAQYERHRRGNVSQRKNQRSHKGERLRHRHGLEHLSFDSRSDLLQRVY
jgi:hypothetical protein